MSLKLHHLMVHDVRFGERTIFSGGVLQICKAEALAYIREDSHILSADLEIAKPGESVYIVPVKEAVEPRVRTDGRALFPGYTGPVSACGSGELYSFDGTSVLAVGKHWGSFGDGLVSMKDDAAYSAFSQLINICLVADTDEMEERHKQQKTNRVIRLAAHRLAEYLGSAALRNRAFPEADFSETFDFTPVIHRRSANDLPNVVLVLQAQSQMEIPGYNDLLLGWDMNHYLPSFIKPEMVLDGALVSGSFMPSSSKWSSYEFQNFHLIKEMFAEDGKTLNFSGVVLSNLNVSMEQKERSAVMVAQLASALGADAAIVAEEGYGNPDADFIRCIERLEESGVKTVGICNECSGRDGRSQSLVVLSQLADALVSTGNVSELLRLPPADRIIGELAALGRDGLSGGWDWDEKLGPSVQADGSIVMEDNAVFCGDHTSGRSVKTVAEF